MRTVPKETLQARTGSWLCL